MVGACHTYLSYDGSKNSKLDRILVCDKVVDKWSNARVTALSRDRSDHRPVLFSVVSDNFGPLPFRFFNSWLDEIGLEDVVKQAWETELVAKTIGVRIAEKLKLLKVKIKEWRIGVVKERSKYLDVSKAVVSKLELMAEKRALTLEERKLRIEAIGKILGTEATKEKDLYQKARVKWIKFGDENSSLFHKIINSHVLKNRVNGVMVEGVWVTDPERVKEHFKEFFKKKFKEPMERRPKILANGFKTLSSQQAESLIASFSKEEIKCVVWECGGDKAPGPDGWWGVLDSIISDSQSAFLGGRNIVDGPLILNEVYAWAKKYKSACMFFKVDFEKAYDALNWKFLIMLMKHMGFPSKWRCWILGILYSGSSSVLVNGSPTTEFVLERGLRQGDPISPFLFIIAMEALHNMMMRASTNGVFKGVNLPNGGPLILIFSMQMM
ncbi:putative RNA-directed DNA polymerase [Helianthus debilis subsp. tardiflorus]